MSTEKDENQLNSIMKEYSRLTDEYARLGGFEYQSRAKGVLKGLGFEEDQFSLNVMNLSGGRNKACPGKASSYRTGYSSSGRAYKHLDIKAVEWLEEFLSNYKKCLMVISHDRYFLDKITNKHWKLKTVNASSTTAIIQDI